MIVLLTLCVMITANLLRSKVGRAWIAIRDNDIAAETLGINIIWYKLLNFFVAGSIAGLAGAFWVSSAAAISPEHFPWFWSLWLVGVILIGGVGSIHGVIFGSIFMVVVMELIQLAVISLSDVFPALMVKFLYIKESVFGLVICAFLILNQEVSVIGGGRSRTILIYGRFPINHAPPPSRGEGGEKEFKKGVMHVIDGREKRINPLLLLSFSISTGGER